MKVDAFSAKKDTSLMKNVKKFTKEQFSMQRLILSTNIHQYQSKKFQKKIYVTVDAREQKENRYL